MLNLLLGGVYFDLNMIYQLGVIINSVRIHKWLKNIDPTDKASFMEFFRKNTNIGFIIFFLIILGRIGSSDPVHQKIKQDKEEELKQAQTAASPRK